MTKIRSAILVGYENDSIAQAQREPFIYYEKQLKQSLNLVVKQFSAETFTEIDQICRNNDSDIIFLLPSWRQSITEELLNLAENKVKQLKIDFPDRKLIFIDPFAQANSNYFRLLPYGDYFLKRQCYKDSEIYNQKLIGGSLFTDFLSKTWDLDFSEWYVGSDVPEGNLHKIIAGWNLGTAKKFKPSPLKNLMAKFNKQKDIDIFCRLSLGNTEKNQWYTEYRIKAVESLNPLVTDYKVAKSGRDNNSLVSRRQYNSEINNSKIVFSPFGWGENCWRDFEAVACNSLLIKPSMTHLVTNPNIFIDYETYVPVKWDFSDLEEKCRYYLEHTDEANKIRKKAKEVYENFFQEEQFVKIIGNLIK